MIIIFTLVIFLLGAFAQKLMEKRKFTVACGLAVAVTVGAIFLQATANYVLNHRGYGYSYYNRF